MRFFIGFVLFVLSALPALSNQLLRSETPDWVVKLETNDIPQANPAHAQNGVYDIVSDHQIKWIGGRRLTYSRSVVRILSQPGVEYMGRLTRGFSPQNDTLHLLDLKILRDGQTIDLKQSVKETILRRETDLERGIIDGGLTVHMELPDLRVGDVLESAFMWDTTPLFGGYGQSGHFQLEYGVPVGVSRVVLNWPTGRPLNTKLHGTGNSQSHVIHESTRQPDGSTRHIWTYPLRATRETEQDTPPGVFQLASLEFSAFEDWNTATKGLQEFYAQSHPLPASWLARIDQIRADHETPADRAIAALRMVQDDIRYVGIEIGAGGYFARAPQLVVGKGYGDCKDKSVLLVETLRALDIPAQVVLVDTRIGKALDDTLPTPHAFNHMIVRATIAGKRYWFDPTISLQGGGLDHLTTPDYGFVLSLDAAGEGAHGLEKLSQTSVLPHREEMTETFRFGKFGLTLTTISEFRGRAANEQRVYWARNSAVDIQRHYHDYYRTLFPGILVLKPAEIVDLRAENKVIVRETYRLSNVDLNDPDLIEDFPFQNGRALRQLYPERIRSRRETPLMVPHPIDYRHKIQIHNAPIDFAAPEPVFLTNDAFEFRFNGIATPGGSLRLEWALQSARDRVPAQTVRQVRKDLERVQDIRGFTWNLVAQETGGRDGASGLLGGFLQGLVDQTAKTSEEGNEK